MSFWQEIEDKDDVEIDGDDINVLTSSDNFGNNYIHFPKQWIIDLLEKEKTK